MRGSFSDFGTRDTINWVDRSSPLNSPPDSPDLKPLKKIPAPMQGDQSVDDYFKMIKIYIVALSIDLDNQDLKETFFNGLSRENKIKAIRFGIKKPIKEIVERIKKIGNASTAETGYTDIQNFQFGCLE
ncbi:hypothetical protein Glove_441g97 [Diversispora epigaea]|uniref:Retrotransposon gag domain-containing protein n=1 Tax=Diversispora epigaea TaxID=1348612 RepID=A0A397GSB4_9GLOM|nr:hypothetical protein Glove_441g97 [Diversispora epigaea]